MSEIIIWSVKDDKIRKRAELIAPDFVRVTVEGDYGN